MTTLTIDLPPEVYDRLSAAAHQQQKPVEALAREWIAERSVTAPEPTERERVREALRSAGLLAEPTSEMRRIAASSTLSLSEAQAILDRTEGPPLSEVIIEMRGPKA